GIRFSHLVGGGHQINLFEDIKLLQLYQAMDNMRNRYGENALMKASSIDTKFKNYPNPFNGK
ncbi:MAG: DNA polymerase IV, partial [Crocinitomicaceae bacterium]